MDTFGLLLHGLAGALTPHNLLYALIGVTLGTAVGVLPGIGPALTVALLLPVTYQLGPTGSLIMFAGIYYGGMYGGSTTSILLNTPGESASIITALEGNKMARAGRGGPALATAAIGSFVAGLIATVGLAFISPWVVKFALSLGPADYFALMVLAFVIVQDMERRRQAQQVVMRKAELPSPRVVMFEIIVYQEGLVQEDAPRLKRLHDGSK